jgi:RHS repeat-associated protein
VNQRLRRLRPQNLGDRPQGPAPARTTSYASYTAFNVSRGYSVNGLNQYTAAGGATFAYDANGNLTSDGTNSYVYDAENRLVSRSGGVSLAYDPLGRLWQVASPTTLTRFLYDGDRLAIEYDGAGTVLRAYDHGTGADEPLIWYEAVPGGISRRYLHADHQGSIVAVADQNGNPIAINAYDAWGIPNAGNIGRFGYTGQAWLAELGMWYYKARIYSPTLGRFLQTDPVGYKDQVNLYAYVGNDPVDGRDPTGKVVELNGHHSDRREFIKNSERSLGIQLSQRNGHIEAAPARPGAHESVAATTMRNAIGSKATIVLNVVKNSPGVFVDSFPTKDVDAGDIASMQQRDVTLGAAILTHILQERIEAAQNGLPFGAAHISALHQEAAVMGNGAVTRIDNQQTAPNQSFSMQYLDSSGNTTASYTFANDRNGTPR